MAGERWRRWAARVAVLLAAAIVALSLQWLWQFAQRDDPAVIDSSEIVRTADSACALMRDQTSAASVPTSASIGERVGAINAQNDAVTQLVTTIRDLGEQSIAADQPTERWLADWQRLVTARDQYAHSLAVGKPRPLAMPTIAGRSLTDRLNNVGLGCRVPFALLTP
jgi:hypothetical protein